jgi:hypothetical protein
MGELTKLLKSFLTRLTQQSPRTNLVAEISPETKLLRIDTLPVSLLSPLRHNKEERTRSNQLK